MDAGDDLPAGCELLRYASGTQVFGDMVDGGAFKPREVDKGLLSVHRRGAFSSDPIRDMNTFRQVKAQWLTLRNSGRFAQISRAAMEQCAAEGERSFTFSHDPLSANDKPDDPSHALIGGIPDTDDDVAIAIRDMISMRVSRLHLAIEKRK